MYSNYKEPPEKSVQQMPSDTSENVAKAFSSYQNISRNSASSFKDPYIARAQVHGNNNKNRYSAEILQTSKKDVQVMTQSDFSLNRPGKPVGRTHSEMVKNGAGFYRTGMPGKNTAPPHYYANKPVILTPGHLVATRNPYGRGVLMRAQPNMGGVGFGYRQMQSLDRYQVNNRAGGLKDRSVFAAPERDHPDIVRGNFIMRSNTFTPQDTSLKPMTTPREFSKVSSSNQVSGGIKKGRSSSEKKPSKAEVEMRQKQQHKSKGQGQKARAHRVSAPVNTDEIKTESSQLKQQGTKQPQAGDDPNAIYAVPQKKRGKPIEVNNNEEVQANKPKPSVHEERNHQSSDVSPPPMVPPAPMFVSEPNIATSFVEEPPQPSPSLKEKITKEPLKVRNLKIWVGKIPKV